MNFLTFVTLTIAASALPFAARAAWYLLSLRGRIDALEDEIERIDSELRGNHRFYREAPGLTYYLQQKICPDPKRAAATLRRIEKIPERDRHLRTRKEALEAKLRCLERRLPD